MIPALDRDKRLAIREALHCGSGNGSRRGVRPLAKSLGRVRTQAEDRVEITPPLGSLPGDVFPGSLAHCREICLDVGTETWMVEAGPRRRLARGRRRGHLTAIG